MGLTLKQEMFCQKFIEVGNASKAYRVVYGSSLTKPSTCYQNAYLLRKKPKIAVRINALMKERERQVLETIAARSGYRIPAILRKLRKC